MTGPSVSALLAGLVAAMLLAACQDFEIVLPDQVAPYGSLTPAYQEKYGP